MAWLIPLFPLAAAILAYGTGRSWSRTVWSIVAVGVSGVILLLAVMAVSNHWTGAYAWSDHLAITLLITPLSAVFLFIVPLIAAPVLLYAAYHERYSELRRLLSLLMIFVGAMELLILAADFLTLLIAWEAVGACSWALINQEWRERNNARQAGWAFLVTRLGDLGLFFAAFTAFSATGSLAYADLANASHLQLQIVGGGVIVAAAAKSAQVPFSPWLFSAMAGPVPVSALLHAATMVAAGVYVLVRLYSPLSAIVWFGPMVVAIGLLTAVSAAVVASLQKHPKKLFAASTSAHYGLMWISVGVGYPAIAALHFVAHAAMKATAFLVGGVAGKASGSHSLNDMALGRQLSSIAPASLITMLALAGMLPLGAAWSKEKIITATGHLSLWLAIATMTAGAIAATYATRFQLLTFAKNPGAKRPQALPSKWETLAIYFLTFLTVAFSLIWLPGVSAWLESLLNSDIPSFKFWEVSLSLLLLLIGGGIGVLLAHKKSMTESAAAQHMANWFELPNLARFAILRPLQYVTQWFAKADDGIIDAGSRGLGNQVARLAKFISRIDERVIDASFNDAGKNMEKLANLISRFDDGVIDAVISLLIRFLRFLAGFNAKVSEWLFEAIPRQSAWLSHNLGSWVQRSQTGMSHHYYTVVIVGLSSFIVILLTGEFS